ncbi:MAG: hypothetical protein A2X52_12745 [Candidatus Rokubacteria bacterium GWC2_70_16]|nr:MAG: hypothetical protein A2X52_12745 [Candidatus Rokubacteria bacterium GWC2_70_16]OGL19633.1 MAG: hypothetical protein A3K12_16580 [Candidatus Rokubacteria bacterium RIFCSPLOWO2_12_FULL_71_19]
MRPVAILLAWIAFLAGFSGSGTAAPRQVKVVIEFRQQDRASQQGVQGSGGVSVRSRSTRAGGGVAAEDTATVTTRIGRQIVDAPLLDMRLEIVDARRVT